VPAQYVVGNSGTKLINTEGIPDWDGHSIYIQHDGVHYKVEGLIERAFGYSTFTLVGQQMVTRHKITLSPCMSPRCDFFDKDIYTVDLHDHTVPGQVVVHEGAPMKGVLAHEEILAPANVPLVAEPARVNQVYF